ncbi:pyridine nucleotide-disulfide oxidoreductase domain-containing protein 2 isoform X1 [Arapaima gigas]
MWRCRVRSTVPAARPATRASHAAALKARYDAVVIGGGHNGLIAAAYLQKAGLDTVVLERRHVLGGAAVSEEIVPGFHFSRASYLLSLLRPHIYKDLELQKHGLKVYMRDPHAFTPMLEEGVGGRPPRSLLLGSNMEKNLQEIGKFSEKDAKAYPMFQNHLNKLACAIHPLLDAPPLDIAGITEGSLRRRAAALRTLRPLLQCGMETQRSICCTQLLLFQLICSASVLNRWFESEPLKATLATDAVIGAMVSPRSPGSGYVLLHHVMGELEKEKGAWGYVEGGMGGVSNAIASSARALGASIFTEMDVAEVLVDQNGHAKGAVLKDGFEIHSKVVLSNATPHVTFRQLTPQVTVLLLCFANLEHPSSLLTVAVDRLPSFLAAPNCHEGAPGPHHQCSIHINCESVDVLEEAYQECQRGHPSTRPMLEMCIPSVLDPTLAPPGCHVVSVFSQFTPYWLEGGRSWTENDREKYADTVFNWIERYAPGFRSTIVGKEVLTPPDLERIFGLTGGNIFHGAMSLDQLYLARPTPSVSNYRSPVKNLYLCGSGGHPGGGVMGSAGWNAAMIVLADLRRG